MAVLITGGAGFIGSSLADKLLAEGMNVIALDNFNDYYSPAVKRANIKNALGNKRFNLEERDIRDNLDNIFGRYKVSCVIHLAARAGVRPSLENPVLYDSVNVGGTVNLLESCVRAGVKKIIFGSSSSVYGVSRRLPFKEDDPLENPVSPYAVTKIAGEKLCRVYYNTYGIGIVCLRFFTVYGPRQRPEMAVHKFTKLIEKGGEIPFYGDGTSGRDYTYITDILEGIRAAMDVKHGFYIINLGDSKTVCLRDMVKIIEDAAGKKAVLNRMPPQKGDVPITYADVSFAERILGYKPKIDINSGIRRFVEWYNKKEG